ncbi:MAG: hypothetical protein NC311_10045 [Muribaculaceae bacterium]|nr:hypothetical protein [Muribaculaceae bacterium]
MPKVTIAVKKTTTYSEVREVTDEQYSRLLNGDNPFYDELCAKLGTDGEASHDYAVLDQHGEKYLMDWSD